MNPILHHAPSGYAPVNVVSFDRKPTSKKENSVDSAMDGITFGSGTAFGRIDNAL